MSRALWAALLTVFIISAEARAITKSGHYTILGEGNTSCGGWVQERNEGRSWMHEAAWVLGYLTAFNERVWKDGSNIAKGTDPDGIHAWLDAYCASHPLDNIERATQALVSELSRRQRH